MFSYFEKLIDPFPSEPPEQPPTGIYRFCRHYCRGIERHLLLLAVLTTLTAVGEALLFAILGQLVDWLAASDPDTFIEQQWPTLTMMAIFVLLFMPAAVIFQSLLVHQTLLGNFPMLVRWQSHRFLLNQSYAFFQREFSGRIATKVMQTALAVRESVMKMMDVMLFVCVYTITALILVASADLRLSLPIVLWLGLYGLILRYFVPRLQSVAMSQADARSLMTGRIVDSYSNILTLKLFSHNSREEAYAKDAMSQFLDTVHPQMRLVTQLNGAVWIINMLLIAAITGLGIYLWINDSVSPGAVAVGVSLAIRLTGMSHWVMWEVSGLFESIGTVQDGINTIALAQTVSDVDIPQTLTHCTGAIAFQSVYFGYNRAAPLFEDFNLQIASGERVGIVGRSGAGKSTLTNLLLRFYALERGTITIDGVDISDLSQQQLRSHIGVVTQDTSLLHRSVGDNILFGAPASTPEQVRAAAVKAEAHDFIMTLRDSDGGSGYDSQVGERGVSLSGGQRQRIAIARVILKNAPILVLDEATSALDSEVEALIQGSLDKLMDGKTVIAIAHRLSTIAAMDRLLVIDRGAIVEQGSHRQLIAANGLYARLWQHQSGGFIGEE